MITIPNDHIACEPFESLAIQVEGKGFVTAKQKNALFSTKVVYPNSREMTVGPFQGYPYQPGHMIYVDGADLTLEYAKRKYTLGGKQVILVPCNRILAWESGS